MTWLAKLMRGRREDSDTMVRTIPDDPVVFIQECVRERRIFWTYHVNMRLIGRRIDRALLLAAVDSYELVEAYPDDKYLPSYLVLARLDADVFHVLFAVDVEAARPCRHRVSACSGRVGC